MKSFDLGSLLLTIPCYLIFVVVSACIIKLTIYVELFSNFTPLCERLKLKVVLRLSSLCYRCSLPNIKIGFSFCRAYAACK